MFKNEHLKIGLKIYNPEVKKFYIKKNKVCPKIRINVRVHRDGWNAGNKTNG
ncbi:hypothetical protein [Oribacterium sp. KHPX15]|uniref:hypothetical protein n=1 Tax=Oribacterium sp. KHPX15 TaxID=1855342 RepID=UPI0015876552|nr:hypothetical protein [Oribacterium sp. KHPX15]